MPAKSPAAIRQQIASGHPDPIYLVQGDDDSEKSALAGEFADLVDEGLRAFNVERIHAGDMTTGDKLAGGIASLIAAARTLPMMSPWRVILVMQAEALVAPRRESESATRALAQFEAYLQQPETRTVLVLVAAPIDKRLRMFKVVAKHATVADCGSPEDVAGAERWVRARVTSSGVAIEPAAARLLVARAGFSDRARPDGKTGNLQRVRGDVDRLLLYALGQKVITVDDVKQIAGPAALQDDWAMTRAIEQRNAADALRQLALTLEAGAPPEKVLGQLGWLVRARFPASAPGDLVAAVEALFRTDLDLKRSVGDSRVLLERLVVELCAGTRGRQPLAAIRVVNRDL
jgi:DNA polymerase III delta subunit